MDAILKEINAVVGVVGSFVCTADGNVVAKAVPENFDAAQLDVAARVTAQTFHALETSGQRISDVDLSFDKGRLVLKNLRGGVLSIICVRNINIPLLNLTANSVVKKLAAEVKPAKQETSSVATPAPVKTAAATTAPSTPPAVAPTIAPAMTLPPLVAELEQEARRLIEEGKPYRVRLRVLSDLAIWLVCPRRRDLLAPFERKHIEFGGFASESESIEMLFKQLGYTSDHKFNAFYGNKRLRFANTKRDLTADIWLDNLEMYQRLDLVPFLTQDEFCLPITALVLSRLQLVEINESGLHDLGALFLENDLGVGAEKGKIDATYVTRLCADDWSWYKTVSLNLDRLTTLATANLPAADRTLITERAQRLRQSMDSAPKSLRWQTRARLGESVKWYETPLIYRPGHARPDMALG